MLSGKRIILGVTGGIAAYKSAYLLREFQKAGAEIRVTMTPSATRFVGSETFSALSRNPVAVDVFSGDQPDDDWTKHIHWGEWADLFIIAPCTANTLSKIVHGGSDNMLTATVLAARCPILICPTMDGEMYESPAVSDNLKKAAQMGYHILEPETGYLASGLEAKGRLPELSEILHQADEIIEKNRAKGPLSGKKVLVTAGPTREYIDPVRFISNPSSGKMGVAMADAAVRLGGEVRLLKGPVHIKPDERMNTESFMSAADLFEKVKHHADADVIIMAAAVSDFTPAERSDQKVKKESASDTISLNKTTDILQWLGERKPGGQTLIGFAMETENLKQNAQKKLQDKNSDWICANDLGGKDAGFESDSNTIHLIGKESQKTFQGTKKQIALQILREIFQKP
ncbi:bifunctional phosphopantothenoylcysteine decarboxylase/phosphopantothenate--cysteine ligase CoaBC [Rhodohalobacter sp. SW132]|uniref:bifunctional phosphopantothenoylcysteine decarboxylase/phosphopantothenate--cysteine ligase CoaBC n=1 Tax=Rhodohalobacter sp. SW132 TaxID=2293433 RepID=UPI000E2874D5|nr:bifunctional phosphopantothenoylcysteine decarboxylase/phosphopantothenate--cysteine ligase CoaBC [Rhodohalobacter sp. SW132]REL24336.1 bifunctional phosphopantothenoylcysteine decarboxylase/phosphopantothenate--cysteine ligase CoaBC [Rhodohalobacter sp. SW132]